MLGESDRVAASLPSSWRWIFIINVPIGIVALAVGAVIAPNARHHPETGIPDMLGVAVLVVVVDSAQLSAVALHDFKISWYWSAGFIFLAALTSWRLLAPAGKPDPVADAEAVEEAVT